MVIFNSSGNVEAKESNNPDFPQFKPSQRPDFSHTLGVASRPPPPPSSGPSHACGQLRNGDEVKCKICETTSRVNLRTKAMMTRQDVSQMLVS